MSQTPIDEYTTNLAFYEKLIASYPDVDRKGKTMPYTSLNGHMFSFLGKNGKMALRHPKEERESFVAKFETEPCVQYEAVMKEYVLVPNDLLKKTQALKAFFDISYAYIGSLKPKPTKKKSP